MPAVLGLATLGCSRQRAERPATYAARGVVLVADKPAAGAKVQLNPVEGKRLAAAYPHAIVQSDGSFRLTTYKTGDGAPAGTYALTVTWPGPPERGREEGPDRLQGRYADRFHPVSEVHIVAGENDLGAIRLK